MMTLAYEYPVMLRLEGKKTIVVGGGTVAERKISSLLEAHADITVISPSVTNNIQQWAEHHRLTWLQKPFEAVDLDGAFLIIAATNYREINQKVYEDANQQLLINRVDQEEKSNFIVPASFKRGKLTIAISTSGASPGLARKLKKELETVYDDTYEEYLDFLHDCRGKIQREISSPQVRQFIYKGLLNNEFLQLTRLKEYSKRDERFLQLWREGLENDE